MEALYQSDPYLRTAQLIITGAHDDGVLIERSHFYPLGGGQPGDRGTLELADGRTVPVLGTRYGPQRQSVLLLLRADDVPLANRAALPTLAAELTPGTVVTGHIDWPFRYNLMRVHTALHLLSVAVPHPVTGGQISDGEGRLDFDIADPALDKDALSERLQALVDGDHTVSHTWISDAQLDAQPELVKTMSVKPPRGSGHIRLIKIGDIDLQPCGGTHVETTAEIGALAVTKIENKGKQNRRVRIRLLDDAR